MKHNDPKMMWHSKATQREQFADLQAYLKKQEKSKIIILRLYLKELGRKRRRKQKAKFSSRMDIMIREVNEIKAKK